MVNRINPKNSKSDTYEIHLLNPLIMLLSVKDLFQRSFLEMIVKNSDFESLKRCSFTR